MKKILFIFLMCFVGATNAGYAQQPKFVYCQVVSMDNLSAISVSKVVVIFGDNMKQYENRIMNDASGKKVKINGMVNALNFMSKLGWELDQATMVPQAGTSGTTLHFNYSYVMRKNFADLEENEKQEFLKN